MEIAIDFDGTCVTHEFPKVGKDIGAQQVLKALVSSGHKLILYTMRDKKYLDEAIGWFLSNGIELYGIQSNPTQTVWTSSPKCYAQMYIDDAALGCPLIFDSEISLRPFVDWKAVEKILLDKYILEPTSPQA